MQFFRKHKRLFVTVTVITFFAEVLSPLSVFAITGHNSMPEYRSFEPVTTTNMVNVFDGSFTYNIPLLNIPNGYPINLSYHSGDVNNEALASWAGLGWTINPGAINRVKRGFPDEFDGEPVTYHSKMPDNKTFSATIGASMEFFGGETFFSAGALNLSGTITFNNYKGMGTSFSAGVVSPVGLASLDFSLSGGKRQFKPSINYGAVITQAMSGAIKSKKEMSADDQDINAKVNEIMGKADPKLSGRMKRFLAGRVRNVLKSNDPSSSHIGFSYGGFSGGTQGSFFSVSDMPATSYPTTITPYTGTGFSLKVEAGINPFPIPSDLEGSIMGSYMKQENVASQTKTVYGYFNNEKALDDEAYMMDYFTEMEKTFEPREKVIGYPLPNNDLFSLTGEAIGGSFRPYRSDYGHYRKNLTESKTKTGSIGADINAASVASAIPGIVSNLVYTAGGNLGYDNQVMRVGDWDEKLKATDDEDDIDAADLTFRSDADFPVSSEKVFMRFTGDKGGSFNLADNDEDFKPQLKVKGLKATPFGFNNKTHIDNRKENQRSTYISSGRIEDFNERSNGKRYKVNEKELRYISGSSAKNYDYDGTYPDKAIGEFTTYNSDGVRYVYGLPVFTKNEKQLQYSLESEHYNLSSNGLVAEITTDFSESDAKRKLGYESNTEYATTYLLTQINSPDYVDRTLDGPTADDFGSYTRFNYRRVHGGSGDWYPYRNPYTGLNFNWGSLSDDKDDMGSYNFGEKEVYYLHSVASKTHVAIFRLENRDDGLSAEVNSDAEALATGEGSVQKRLKKLVRIDLYNIADCQVIDDEDGNESGIYEPVSDAVPIKSVHFDYDYSLCPNVPNNINADPNASTPPANSGKLTLKKVWFEYQGKIRSKITPYTFEYEYPGTGIYPSRYSGLEMNPNLVENPPYAVENTDRWGNYRDYASMVADLGDLAPFYPFVDQSPDYSTFDPAAYLLKQINLPSGGEIHVQYEQHDYQYVQEKKAMVMIPLKGDNAMEDNKDAKFYLDLDKIGVDFDALSYPDKKRLLEELFEPIKSERIYFNFLYGFIDDPDPFKDNSEYIEGYALIAGFGFDETSTTDNTIRPFFTFKNSNPDMNGTGFSNYFESIDYGARYSKREIPQKVCIDFYNTNRRGMVDGKANALAAEDPDGEDEDKAEAALKTMLKVAESALTPNPLLCKKILPSSSYVRLQSPNPKIGGGLRVKRLLRYDQGMATGDEVLYGQEYDYVTNDHGQQISSGVATNEPAVGRRENPLIQPLPRNSQSGREVFLSGRDMYSQEGPVGESLLPAPSVGYSRVAIRNIHDGITSPGYEIHEFFTAREYPFKASYTTIDEVLKPSMGGNAGASLGGIGIGLGYTRKTPYMAQGFSFVTNSMHGQLKRIAKYPGTATENPVLVAEEVYEYVEPGEQVAVMNENFVVESALIGRESEVLSEMRQVEEIVTGANAEADLSGGGFIITAPIPFIPVAIPTLKKFGFYSSEKTLRTHVTTKIVHYPAIVKKVTRSADGVRHVTENQVFDKYTGNPVVVKSYDDFEGTFVSQDFMASWNYENMRSRALNEKAASVSESGYLDIGYGSDIRGEYIQFEGGADCGESSKYVTGDLIEMKHSCSTDPALYHVEDIDAVNDKIYITPSGMDNTTCSPTSVSSVTVIQSGYTNQLNTKMGNILAHDETSAGSYYDSDDGGLDATSNPFVVALNNALDAAITSSSTSGELDLSASGSFNDVSVLLDECNNIDAVCDEFGSGASISNVLMGYNINSSTQQMKLWVKSFNVDGTSVSVDCGDQQDDNGPVTDRLFTVDVIPVNNLTSRSGSCDDECKDQNVVDASIIEDAIYWASDTRLMTVCITGKEQKMKVNPKPFVKWSPIHTYRWSVRKTSSPSGSTYGWKQSGKSNFFFTYNLTTSTTGDHLLIDEEHGAIYEVNCKKYNIFGNVVDNEIMEIQLAAAPPEDIEIKNDEDELVACKTESESSHTIVFEGDYFAKGSPAAEAEWKIIGNWTTEPEQSLTNTGNIEVTFFDPGVYEIRYSVTNELGACGSTTAYFTYNDCRPCYSNVDGEDEVCLANSSDGWDYTSVNTTFTRIDDVNQQCSTANCNWEVINNQTGSKIFEDNGNCNQITPTFTEPGIYTVNLNITNTNDGQDRTGQHVIVIKDCRPPRATFSIADPTCPDKEVEITVDQSSRVENYSWDMGDGNTLTGSNLTAFMHTYEDCDPKDITLTITNSTGIDQATGNQDQSYTNSINYTGNQNFECHPVCACYNEFPVKTLINNDNFTSFTTDVGQFYVNTRTGEIVYQEKGCTRQFSFNCIQLCGAASPTPTLSNIVTASATTFNNYWDYLDKESIYHPDNNFSGDLFELAVLGKWRPESQYTYRSGLDKNNEQLNKERGTFPLEIFDWKASENNSDQWVLTSTTTRYSPNGEPLEDKNILDIFSAAKYGYNHTLPVLVAQNARYHTVAYESFENTYDYDSETFFEDGLKYDNTKGTHTDNYSHTGRYSVALEPGVFFKAGNISASGQVMVRGWFRVNPDRDPLDGKIKVKYGNNRSTFMYKVASAGEWGLYEAVIKDASSQSVNIWIQIPDTYNPGDVHLDDVRMQPFESEMVCYVYNKNQQLEAVFDDQHFALIYEYNAEGDLVRKLKETREGIKTISETQYNVKGEDRQ